MAFRCSSVTSGDRFLTYKTLRAPYSRPRGPPAAAPSGAGVDIEGPGVDSIAAAERRLLQLSRHRRLLQLERHPRKAAAAAQQTPDGSRSCWRRRTRKMPVGSPSRQKHSKMRLQGGPPSGFHSCAMVCDNRQQQSRRSRGATFEAGGASHFKASKMKAKTSRNDRELSVLPVHPVAPGGRGAGGAILQGCSERGSKRVSVFRK